MVVRERVFVVEFNVKNVHFHILCVSIRFYLLNHFIIRAISGDVSHFGTQKRTAGLCHVLSTIALLQSGSRRTASGRTTALGVDASVVVAVISCFVMCINVSLIFRVSITRVLTSGLTDSSSVSTTAISNRVAQSTTT